MTHLSSSHVATINAYVSKFGLPETQGGRNPSPSDIEANKERGRAWIKDLIATLTHYYPSNNFVRKRGDRNRPWSNESVSWLDGNRLYGIDLLVNAGVEWQTFNIGHVEDLTGQDWERVPAHDHLNGTVPVEPKPNTPPTDLTPLYNAIASLSMQLDVLNTKLDHLTNLQLSHETNEENRYNNLGREVQHTNTLISQIRR